jgi:hypothetical protein
MTHTPEEFQAAIDRVVAILSPPVSNADPEAMPIFDWPHGRHPDPTELRNLAERLVSAILNGTP